MGQIYQELHELFDNENKEEAVMYILNKLERNEIDIIELYVNILTPLLNDTNYKLDDKKVCIWKEHVRTAIGRTIVECCYPFVIKKREEYHSSQKGVATVLCPPEEYHDLGARMVADFFTIAGFDTIFVGGSTPYQDFYHAIPIINPKVVAISVSNYYNLVAAKRMIEELRQKIKSPIKVVVGGYAFHEDEKAKVKAVGADYYAHAFEDILQIAEDGVTV